MAAGRRLEFQMPQRFHRAVFLEECFAKPFPVSSEPFTAHELNLLRPPGTASLQIADEGIWPATRALRIDEIFVAVAAARIEGTRVQRAADWTNCQGKEYSFGVVD